MKAQLGAFARKTLVGSSGQWLLKQATAVYSVYSRGGYTPVSIQDGLWIHKTPDGYLIDRYANFSATMSHYRTQTMDYWGYLYKPQLGDVIIDIGAGIGTEVACFSPAIGAEGVLVSVEAHPSTFHALDLFCRLNGFENVKRVHAAVHSSEEPVFIDNPTSHVGSSIVNQREGVMVPGTTVDHLVAQYKLSQVDFIKMNIEGAEQYALNGMAEVLRKTRYVCIACHDFKADRTGEEGFRTKALVKAFLEELGFVVVERKGDSRPWVNDQVNAYNSSLVNS